MIVDRLCEFYTDEEIREIKQEAREVAEITQLEGEYECYLEWKYNEAKKAEDHRLASLAGELRGLPGCD